MSTITEHRECSRSPLTARIEARLGNGIVVEGQAVDVSLSGLMFLTDRRLPVGKPVHVAVIFERGIAPERIEVGGRVSRLDDDGVAVEFGGIGAGSIQELRRLVLYNDPEAGHAGYAIADHLEIGGKN